MRTSRIYVDTELPPGEVISLPAPAVQHLVQVLRLRVGDQLMLFNGDGHDYPAEVIGSNRHRVEVRLGEAGPPEPPLALQVHLGIGISKGDRMDLALQKAVELGAAEITPLFTGRAVVRLEGDRLAKRPDHWEGVMIAACEQSARRRLARLNPVQPLESWLDLDHPRPCSSTPAPNAPSPVCPRPVQP